MVRIHFLWFLQLCLSQIEEKSHAPNWNNLFYHTFIRVASGKNTKNFFTETGFGKSNSDK